MSNKIKIVVVIIVVAIAFLAGQKSVPEKTKTVEVEKVVTVVEHKVITIKENPDGSKETTITTDKKTDSKTDKTAEEKTSIKSKTNISLLVGTSSPLSTLDTVYGISANKELIGPVTVGAWVLTNKSIGLSIGLNF